MDNFEFSFSGIDGPAGAYGKVELKVKGSLNSRGSALGQLMLDNERAFLTVVNAVSVYLHISGALEKDDGRALFDAIVMTAEEIRKQFDDGRKNN